MNTRINKKNKASSIGKKAQTSTEYIFIIAGAIIFAAIVVFLAMHFISNSRIGNGDSIIAAGSSSSNELTLELSEPLPSGITNVIITTSGSVPITEPSGGLSVPAPVYTNNYPEYIFTVSAGSPITVDNVTGMTYEQNGQTISLSTEGGTPLSIQPISSANVVTP